MEEILVERTIQVLSEHLNAQVLKVWSKVETQLTVLDENYEATTPPFEFTEKNFYRFNLDEVASSDEGRIVVGCERKVVESSNRGDFVNGYALEILFMFETGYEDIRFRLYIPMRYRNAILDTIQEHYRTILKRSSYFVIRDMGVVEANNDGNRSILAGVLYDVVV